MKSTFAAKVTDSVCKWASPQFDRLFCRLCKLTAWVACTVTEKLDSDLMCVRTCVRACVRACVRVCVCVYIGIVKYFPCI